MWLNCCDTVYVEDNNKAFDNTGFIDHGSVCKRQHNEQKYVSHTIKNEHVQ